MQQTQRVNVNMAIVAQTVVVGIMAAIKWQKGSYVDGNQSWLAMLR